MPCKSTLALLWLLVAAAACATVELPRAVREQAAAPVPPSAQQSTIDERKLLCERIWLQTSASAAAPRKTIFLEHLSSEGGTANIFISGDLVRIEGQILGCSVREHLDYRYVGNELVCSREMSTSMMTVAGCDAEGQPEGECRPPFWGAVSRVFSAGELVSSSREEVPKGGGGEPRTPAETLKLAADLLQRARPGQPTSSPAKSAPEAHDQE